MAIGSSRTTRAEPHVNNRLRRSIHQGDRLDGDLLQIPDRSRQVSQRSDVLGTGGSSCHQVHGNILRGGLQTVQSVTQRLPGVARQQNLVGADPPVIAKTSRLIGTLTMRSAAIPRSTARPNRDWELETTPSTTTDCITFRHSDDSLHPTGPAGRFETVGLNRRTGPMSILRVTSPIEGEPETSEAPPL